MKFYFFLTLISLISITYDELSEEHQAAWNIYRDNLDSAETLFKIALSEYRDILDIRRESVALIDLANLKKNQGNIPERLRYLHKAEQLEKNINDSTIAYTLYNNLSSQYDELGQTEKSLDYLRKEQQYISVDDTSRMIMHRLDISELYLKINQFDKAKANIDYANAIAAFNEKEDVFNKYGLYYYKKQEYDSALICFEKASTIYNVRENRGSINSTLNYYSARQEIYKDVSIATVDSLEMIATKYNKLNLMPNLLSLKAHVLKDTSYLHEALRLAKKLKRFSIAIGLLKDLASLQLELKHYDSHKATTELYNKLNDSLTNANNKIIREALDSSITDNHKNTDNKKSYKIYYLITLSLIFVIILYIVYNKYLKSKKG